MVKGLLVSLSLIFLWVFCQMAVLHLTRTRHLFRALTLLFLLTLPAYLLIYRNTSADLGFLPESLSQTPFFLGLVNGLFLHLLFYFTYLCLFYYVERPLTLRILIAFLNAPGGTLSLSGMKDAYQLPYMIERRLQAMKDGGVVTEEEGKYFLTPKGEALGRCLEMGRNLAKIDRQQSG